MLTLPKYFSLTSYEHENGGGCDVGWRCLPAANDASSEGDEHEEETNEEESNHGPHHI